MVESSKQKGRGNLIYLMLSDIIKQSDVGTFVEQMLCENLIPYKYSFKAIPNTIMWLQAKPNGQTKNYTFSNEFALVYINSRTFEREYASGQLQL
jgi:hypothetical protein